MDNWATLDGAWMKTLRNVSDAVETYLTQKYHVQVNQTTEINHKGVFFFLVTKQDLIFNICLNFS